LGRVGEIRTQVDIAAHAIAVDIVVGITGTSVTDIALPISIGVELIRVGNPRTEVVIATDPVLV